MPRVCCREQHRPSLGQSSSNHQIRGEMALKSTAVWRRTHHSPMLLEAPSRPAWDSGYQLGSCWAPSLKRGRSRAGVGDKQRPTLRGAGRSCSQPEDEEGSVPAADPSPGSKAAAWRRRLKIRHAKAGEEPQALPFAFPQGALPLPHLGSATVWTGAPQHPARSPQPGHILPPRAPPYRSFFIFFSHTITLSSITPVVFPHAPPSPLLLPPRVREFFGPRDQVFSRGQEMHHVLGMVGESHPAPHPLPDMQMGSKKKPQNTKKVRKNPTNHLSQQCTPVFCTLIV